MLDRKDGGSSLGRSCEYRSYDEGNEQRLPNSGLFLVSSEDALVLVVSCRAWAQPLDRRWEISESGNGFRLRSLFHQLGHAYALLRGLRREQLLVNQVLGGLLEQLVPLLCPLSTEGEPQPAQLLEG